MFPFQNRAPAHHPGFEDINAREAANRISEFRVIDVREPAELHGPLQAIEGVELVPLRTLPSVALPWSRDEHILLVCRSGGRSSRAAQFLVSQGFNHVANLEGGMIGWNDAGLPTVKGAGGAR